MNEAKIPTLAERRAGRVTIDVKTDGSLSVRVEGDVHGQRMYTEDEVIAAQASEGELIGRALRADLDQARAECEELHRQINSQGYRLATATHRHQEAQAELKKVRVEREELRRQINSQRNRMETVSRHREEAEAELRKVREERDQFKQVAYRQDDIAADLRREMATLRSDLNAARSHRDALQSRIERALAALNSPTAAEDSVGGALTQRSLALARAVNIAREALSGGTTA